MNIFTNSLGEFQWASVAAIIAGVGAAISLIFSFLGYLNSKVSLEQQKLMDQKKIDADIISKSRMHWIDNTKVIVTTFVSNALELSANNVMFNQKILQLNSKMIQMTQYKNIMEDKNKPKKEKEEAKDIFEHWMNEGSVVFNKEMQQRVDLMSELIKKVYKDYLLIKLNFSDNEEHKSIVDLCFSINEELRKFSLENGWNQFASVVELEKALNNALKIRNSNATKINELTELLRVYYKNEWEKVKSGK